MLTRKPVSQPRRIAATAIILILACTAGATAWAAQPERKIQSTIALPPVVEGESSEVLLPLQLFDGQHQALPRTNVRLNPDEPAPPVGETSTRPKLHLDTPIPEYPAESRALREEGMVTLELCVSKTGAVESAKLLKSSGHPALDEAALHWAPTVELDPATRNGQPVAVCNYPLSYQWMLSSTDTPASPPG
jgi:TonB family protein